MESSSSPAVESDAAVPTFKRRTRPQATQRKRPREDEDEIKDQVKDLDDGDDGAGGEDGDDVQIFKKARTSQRGLTTTTRGARSTREEEFAFGSNSGANLKARDVATISITESNTAIQARKDAGEGIVLDETSGKKIYKGKQRELGLVHGKRAGPLKNVENLRVTVRFDYAPDICKDYKETGFCGYGDACKFMHDRGDYKSGWELEKEFEEQQKKKREAAALELEGGKRRREEEDNEYFIGSDSEAGLSSDDEEATDPNASKGLPKLCPICGQRFTAPVVTRCKHYFCEACAVDRHAVDKRCAVCLLPTGGVFNVAHDLVMREKRWAARAAARAEREARLPTEET